MPTAVRSTDTGWCLQVKEINEEMQPDQICTSGVDTTIVGHAVKQKAKEEVR